MINFPLLFSVRFPMLVRGLKASIDMSQKCTKCKITKDESELTQQKKPKEVGLAKSLKSVIYNAQKNFREKTLEFKYHHLWIRKDGSKIAGLWQIVDDHKCHNCAKCKKEKVVK